jgi:hypothetical protein
MTIHRLNYLARRNPQFSHDDWIPIWRSHYRLASSMGGWDTVRRYVQSEIFVDAADRPHDGLASVEYMSLEARAANRSSQEYHRIMKADETRVFDELVGEFSFIASHEVIFGAGTGPAKLVRYGRAKKGRDLPKEWRSHAQTVVNEAPQLLSYALNLAVQPERPEGWGLQVDGSEEIWFESIDAAEAYRTSHAARHLLEGAPFEVTDEVVANEVILFDRRSD